MSTVSVPTPRSGVRTRRFRRLARLGFAVNGVVHLLIGGLSLRVAFGDETTQEADPSGAIARLAETPAGLVVVWAALVALVALGLWQLSFQSRSSDPSRAKRLGRRIVESGKGFAALALAGTTLVFALGGSTSSSATIRAISTDLLARPAGAIVLTLVGGIVLGSGIGFVAIGVRRGFRKLVRIPAGRRGTAVLILGAAGYVSKGIALGIAGGLFVVAAITGDARRATGLDGALRFLDVPPYGTIALTVIGAGLVMYGGFLIARAKLAKL
ncbi:MULTISPECIES: DUF1206 domain-containing protein [unclassified Rathayibacter]|uniref:DUF1206 domain-containing protein n=1 Tax=unclassified Rathayibacter TaxID=2609250 RepID=UPI0015644933|nr:MULTISPECIES: DUF1206 domain-containing protein [unclassified Rathayibacter]MCJ1674793.1 DUF1206 domain-containing protein [Rathayibacter sp. VKM Ac-2929]MCJ1683756.1 DUF1206 domain-containing protein [Rathayibacter sp. VKM Ac-2928]MCJ1689372.1 DUF1206 domain-containing protein [Rathayibacter sp. VKM Ac-2927]NQX15569.1 DUF1206 domain-containing protein [Rathayibacter sp. VKM Ac-2857]